MAVSPRSSKVYVVNGGSVSVINGLTNHVIANIPGFGNPGGIAVSPKTGPVYVANSGGGTVSVISPLYDTTYTSTISKPLNPIITNTESARSLMQTAYCK